MTPPAKGTGCREDGHTYQEASRAAGGFLNHRKSVFPGCEVGEIVSALVLQIQTSHIQNCTGGSLFWGSVSGNWIPNSAKAASRGGLWL